MLFFRNLRSKDRDSHSISCPELGAKKQTNPPPPFLRNRAGFALHTASVRLLVKSVVIDIEINKGTADRIPEVPDHSDRTNRLRAWPNTRFICNCQVMAPKSQGGEVAREEGGGGRALYACYSIRDSADEVLAHYSLKFLSCGC